MERSYFIHIDNQQLGPLTLAQVREKPITRATLVWYEGLTAWVGAENIDELKDLFTTQAAPPNWTPPPSAPPPATGAKIDPATPPPEWTSNSVLADEIDQHHKRLIAYFIAIVAFIIVAIIIGVIMAVGHSDETAAIVAVFVGVVVLLILMVLQIVHFCKFHYRCWAVAVARTGFNEHTPGMAVGLLFVPLFNIYWGFRSYHQLSVLLGQAVAQPGYERTQAPNAGTAQAYCILNVCAIIPYLGALAGIVALVLWFIMLGENRRACTFLLRSTGA